MPPAKPTPWVVLAVALSACPPIARAQDVGLPRSADAPHVAVDLIADKSAGRAGGYWLGVRFVLDPGWHLYWVNPGDSGSAPEAEWHTPPGTQVAPFEWPVPVVFRADGLVNYGYSGTVVLPARATVAAGARPDGSVSVTLRWLVCRDMCVPGRARLTLSLPTSEPAAGRTPDWDAAIERARSLVPPPAPADWAADAISTSDSFVVTVRTGGPESAGEFFPIEPGLINDSHPRQAGSTPDGIRWTLRKSDQLGRDPASLRGVVTLGGGRAFVVSAPVTRSAQSN